MPTNVQVSAQPSISASTRTRNGDEPAFNGRIRELKKEREAALQKAIQNIDTIVKKIDEELTGGFRDVSILNRHGLIRSSRERRANLLKGRKEKEEELRKLDRCVQTVISVTAQNPDRIEFETKLKTSWKFCRELERTQERIDELKRKECGELNERTIDWLNRKLQKEKEAKWQEEQRLCRIDREIEEYFAKALASVECIDDLIGDDYHGNLLNYSQFKQIRQKRA